MLYQIWFKDSLGWYCPGEPWTNPDATLLQEWQQEIKEHNRKDVAIRKVEKNLMTEQRRVSLFSNSTEYDDWVSQNCQQCSKHRPSAVADAEFICDIDEAIHVDAMFDGCVDSAIAERMEWKGVQSPCGEKQLSSTAYRLPLDKLKFIAELPNTQPDPDIFSSEVMAKNLELLANQSPEFVLGFASGVDWVMGSFEKFQQLSYTADVPVHYFEKIMLTIAVAAAQKYLADKEP